MRLHNLPRINAVGLSHPGTTEGGFQVLGTLEEFYIKFLTELYIDSIPRLF